MLIITKFAITISYSFTFIKNNLKAIMFTLIITIIYTYAGVFCLSSASIYTLDIQSIGSGIGLYSDYCLALQTGITAVYWRRLAQSPSGVSTQDPATAKALTLYGASEADLKSISRLDKKLYSPAGVSSTSGTLATVKFKRNQIKLGDYLVLFAKWNNEPEKKNYFLFYLKVAVIDIDFNTKVFKGIIKEDF